MLGLEILRVLGLGVAWWFVWSRARRWDAARDVWRLHTVALGLLVCGAIGSAVLRAAGADPGWQVVPWAAFGLPAGAFLLFGVLAWRRLHSAVPDAGFWLLTVSCVFAIAALGGLAESQPWFAVSAGELELQFRLLTAGTAIALWSTLAGASAAAGFLRTAPTIVLLSALGGLVVTQVVVVHVGWTVPMQVLLSLTWMVSAAAIARSSRLPNRSPGYIRFSPALDVAAALGVLLCSVAVITTVAVQGENEGFSWPIAWALAAVLGLSGRVAHLVRQLLRARRAHLEARTDDLTGLANRRAFHAALESSVNAAWKVADPVPGRGVNGASGVRGHDVAVLVVDLDGFKDVNDRFGHATGDAVLQHVARTLRAVLPTGSTPARLGGDEFAVLLTGSLVLRVREIADEVVSALAGAPDGPGAPAGRGTAPGDGTVDAAVLATRCSLGVAVCGPRTAAGLVLSGEELLRRADAAMYVVKSAGGGVAEYDGALDARLRRRRALTDDLVAAFGPGSTASGDGPFEVHYQPQLSRSGRAVAVEALVRWRHPEHGLLAPDTWLPLAEAAGLMPALTRFVVFRAVDDQRSWHRAGHEVRLSFNVSASQLGDTDILDLVDGALDRGARAGDLVVEVTETTLFDDPERALEICRQITDRGCELSIDDFGTGYSSLGYLSDLPAHEVKIDRSFTARLLSDPRTASVVAGTIELAHHLDMRVVAEGVEDEATHAKLVQLGCDLTQGYLHSRPVPAQGLLEVLGQVQDRRVSPPGERRGPRVVSTASGVTGRDRSHGS